MLGPELINLPCLLDANELIGCVVVLSFFHNLDVLVRCEHMIFYQNFLPGYSSVPAYRRVALHSLHFDCDHQGSPFLIQ